MIFIDEHKVFEELQQKSREISKHNADLATRLGQNQDMIQRFNTTIDKLREEVGSRVEGEENLLRQMHDHISTIKHLESQLGEKAKTINTLNDSLQHTRDQIVDDFEGRLATLEAQIEEKMSMVNTMKDQLDRKDTFIVKLNTLVEQLNKRISAESELVQNLKKDNLSLLKSRHALQAERVQTTNSFKTSQERVKVSGHLNKELLKRALRAEDHVKKMFANSEEMQRKYKEKITAIELSSAVTRKDHSTRLKENLETGTRKQVALKAENQYLKKQIDLHRKLLTEREGREKEFVDEFNKRFKEMMSVRSQVEVTPIDTVESDSTSKAGAPEVEKVERKVVDPTSKDVGSFSFEKPIEKSIELEHVETYEPKGRTAPPGVAIVHHGMGKPDMSILEPLIERAFESGETREQVKASMLHSGYPEAEVEKVFERLEII